MTHTALFALLSYWRHHLFQLTSLILGLALATALWSAVQAINTQAKSSYAKAEKFSQQFDRHSLTSSADLLRVSDYVSLKRSGWRLSPVLEGELTFEEQDIVITGIDFLTSPQASRLMKTRRTNSNGPNILTMLKHPGGIFLNPQTSLQIADYDLDTQILLSNEVPPGHAIGDIAVVSRLLQEPDKLTRLVLLADTSPTAAAIRSLPKHIQYAPANRRITPGSLTESFHLNLTAFGFLSFVVGLFIVQGTIGLAMEQRRSLFRTLRCLGVPFSKLVVILAIEIAIIASASAFTGLILGYFFAAYLLPDVTATLSGLYGAEVENGLSLRPEWIVSGFGMTILGASFASFHAFFTLWKLPLLQAPSTLGRGLLVMKSFRRWALAGTVMISGGYLFLFFWGGLNGGFAFLGGVMLGTALLLPFCLWHFLRLGEKLTSSPLGQWLWADASAQLPGLSLALMALMLALATNIGVGTMVSSFRLTFSQWLDQRLVAELYVTATSDSQGTVLQAWLEERGMRVLPIRSQELRLASGLIKIYGVVDDPTYRDHWPILEAREQIWDQIAKGNGLLVSEQLARRENLTIGEKMELPKGWPTTVLGIYSDYGNPHGQAVVAMPQLLQNAPTISNQRFGVRLNRSEVPELISSIQKEFDIPRKNLLEQQRIKDASKQVFDQTFIVTSSLKLLTLGVASFAIFTSLVTLWSQRLPQLAPVWAMGVSRRTLALCDILRSLLLAGLTALIALPLGLVLAWALLVVINTEAFGWRLPVYLFPLDWLWLIAMSLGAALLAVALPAWRLFRLSPSDLLKVFSSER